MLHIILLILKFAGIILLCILGLVVFSILCALFVPVRYRIEVTREEGEDMPPVTAYVKITWFLHLINIFICYPADVIVRARILIFTLFRIPEKEKKTKSTARREKQKQEKKAEKEKQASPACKADEGSNDNREEQAERQEGKAGYELVQPNEEADRQTKQNEAALTEQKKFTLTDKIRKLIDKIRKFIDKIRQTVEKIKSFFENIQYTIRNLCDKIKSALDNIQYYREVAESEPFKQSVDLCKDEIGHALRKLKPDKLEADFIAGMPDPAATGRILAFYGMLYPMVGQHIRIAGDFGCERMHIEGRLYIRGRIRAFTFLKVAIKIYFSKDIKTLIKLLKKEAV